MLKATPHLPAETPVGILVPDRKYLVQGAVLEYLKAVCREVYLSQGQGEIRE